MRKSSGKIAPRKSKRTEKPYKGFPMFAHSSGQWAKKIRGKVFYFGVVRDPDAALKRMNRELPFLKQGRTPPAVDVSNGCTLRILANAFLNFKQSLVDSGELSPRTFRDYFKTCEGIIGHFGKDRLVSDLQPFDFQSYRAKLAKRLGTNSLRNAINHVCILLNFAKESNLIDKPVSLGQSFDRPSAKALRRDKNSGGTKLFTRDEILKMLDAVDGKPVAVEGEDEPVTMKANPVLKAMILLGINCGFGNTDVASLPQSVIDFDSGFLMFPRPKTEIPRRIPLWSRTMDALRAAIAVRPAPLESEGKGRCFLTRQGRPWVRVKQKEQEEDGEESGPEAQIPIDALSAEFSKFLHKLHINGRNP